MRRMLQQDEPQDFVIATGESHALEELTSAALAVSISTGTITSTSTRIAYSRGNPEKAKRSMHWAANTWIASQPRCALAPRYCYSDMLPEKLQSIIVHLYGDEHVHPAPKNSGNPMSFSVSRQICPNGGRSSDFVTFHTCSCHLHRVARFEKGLTTGRYVFRLSRRGRELTLLQRPSNRCVAAL
jgi:hypothetical protein